MMPQNEIPTPPGHLLIGNLADVDAEHPNESLARLSSIYGPIFRLYLPAPRVYVGSHAFMDDLCDETRFEKAVGGPLEQVRNAVKDGLFTACPGEENWKLAHKILLPAFGPLSIRSMFGEMQDIVSQMIAKWARFGDDAIIDVTADFTRLTLDSIALCAMGERFNSFYHEEMHPFVHAMTGMLSESNARARRLPIARPLFRSSNQQYQLNIALMQDTARDLLRKRRENPSDKHDLLNAMINGKDPETGKQLDEDVIIRNMITFLIAGHETTSGLLSFLFYELLENPKAMAQLIEEIDGVVGQEPITTAHISKLPYLEACLRETLRLHPTAPAFVLRAKGNQTIGNGYELQGGESVVVVLSVLHRDAEVYGPDAETFNPSRMMKDKFDQLPRNAWKPFGNGLRACVGRPFAWQEAILAVASILQRFHVYKANPSYRLHIRTTLTIKSDGFYMRAALRDPKFLDRLHEHGATSTSVAQAVKEPPAPQTGGNAGPLIDILFGSNTGTWEALSQTLAASAIEHGFTPRVKMLDAAQSLDKAAITVIITGSYEGKPPDNAAHFAEWLDGVSKASLADVKYAVFGVGNKEWHATYQRIPTVFDNTLAEKGAVRLTDRIAVDVAHENVIDELESWAASKLWPAIKSASGESTTTEEQSVSREVKISVGTSFRPSLPRQDLVTAQVTATQLLTAPGRPRKRHIGIKLPTGITYRAGDYLAVLPLNPRENVRRVMQRFQLPWDSIIRIDDAKTTALPTGEHSAYDILSGMIELSQPVTNRQAASVADSIPVQTKRDALQKRVDSKEFQKSSTTLLDLLEQYPEAAFSLGQYLAALPPLHLRQYSISSTPLADPSECSLTYTVIDAPARNPTTGRQFLGVSSTYLERLSVGDHLQVGLRPSRSGFHLPNDDTTPIIMACAGTGLAPFRAFVAERAIKKQGGREVGPALLFYGCNAADDDDMYRDQFDGWEAERVVSVRRAYTHAPQDSEGCRYVQDRIKHDKSEVAELYKRGAQVYMCGAGVVGKGIETAFAEIRQEVDGCDLESAFAWVQKVKGDRFWSDVFA